MCGILAFLGPSPPEGALVPPLHRGPDGSGKKDFVTPAGALRMEHWRLSIIDLSEAGAQPMSYQDGRYWVTFNGEIYNHLELRADLEKRGYLFRSHCDTEVLLAAYVCWGESCLERFTGMFAFVIYDAHARRLFAARDRFGVKPLYFVNAPEGLGLASEIKQLLGLPFVSRRIAPQGGFDFLAYGMLDHTRGTLFRDVQQLLGGECLTLDLWRWKPGQELPLCRWYSLAPRPWTGSLQDAVEAYGSLLRDSVRLRLRSDVPLGSCLSGGMDSSSIVCLVHELLRGQAGVGQATFSSCSEDERFDERRYISHVVGHTGASARYVFPSPDQLFEDLDDLVWCQDEPFGGTSVYAQYCIFRAARQGGVKVMLDGQGGDEQLASYPVFGMPFLLDALAEWRLTEVRRRTAHFNRAHRLGWGTLLKQGVTLYAPVRLEAWVRSLAGRSLLPPWLQADPWRALGACPSKPWVLSLLPEREEDRVQQLSHAMIVRNNLPMLLHWEDRNSMRFGVEARVPFMDHRLVEFALGLPSDFKIEGNQTKIPLRRSMAGIVPQPILDRSDKMGFVTPEEVWLRNSATRQFRHGVDQCLGRFSEILDPSLLRGWFEEVVEGRRPHSQIFWRLLCFDAWSRRFGAEF